jgi:hypothetical protein
MKTSGTYPRVFLAFARKIVTELIAFARNVVTLMTGNPQYPTPSPSLAMITTAVNALETAVHDALDGGKNAIATRNAAEAELLSLLRQLASYVTGNCNADLKTRLGEKSPMSVAAARRLRELYTAWNKPDQAAPYRE